MPAINNKVLETQSYELFRRYKADITPLVTLTYPGLSREEVDMALDYSIKKRFKNTDCILDNNYKQVQIDSSLLDMIEFVLGNDNCIITPYGVIFNKKEKNPLNDMIQNFLKMRKVYKKEMFKYPKSQDLSSPYCRYNLLQLLSKLDK